MALFAAVDSRHAVPKPKDGCERVTDNACRLKAERLAAVVGPGVPTPCCAFSCSTDMNNCAAARGLRG